MSTSSRPPTVTPTGDDPSTASSASTSTAYLLPSPPIEPPSLPPLEQPSANQRGKMREEDMEEDDGIGNESDFDEDEDEDPEFEGLYSNPPTWGPQYYALRRQSFLAGSFFPDQIPVSHPSLSPSAIASSSTPPNPTSVTNRNNNSQPASSLERLELLLSAPGAEETNEAWTKGGVESIHRYLVDGRRLAKGMRLGLVIKILRAGWIKDGTWPLTSGTSTATSVSSDPFFDSPPPSPSSSFTSDLRRPHMPGRAHSAGSSAFTEMPPHRAGSTDRLQHTIRGERVEEQEGVRLDVDMDEER